MTDILQEISTVFNRQAYVYDRSAKIQKEIGSRLFERLDYIKINPVTILDLGCGTGHFTALLKKLYPKAEIIGIDLAYNMLLESKSKQGFWQRWSLVNTDMCHLPFANNSFDLIFANQALHWAPKLSKVFRELNRVMKPEACLMFSTLGPSTFQELRAAWEKVDNYAHTNNFIDMHDIGDCLQREKYSDPVVDMELLRVDYKNLTELVANLKAQGVRNINSNRKAGLTGKQAWKLFEQQYNSYQTAEGKFPLTYEVVYGNAWKIEKQEKAGNEILIPISAISRTKNLE